MSEDELKSVFDLASIDVEAMKAAQEHLDRQQRVLAGSAFAKKLQASSTECASSSARCTCLSSSSSRS